MRAVPCRLPTGWPPRVHEAPKSESAAPFLRRSCCGEIAAQEETNKEKGYVQPTSKKILRYETYNDTFWVHASKSVTTLGDVNEAPINSCYMKREDAEQTPKGLFTIHTCKKHYLILEWK